MHLCGSDDNAIQASLKKNMFILTFSLLPPIIYYLPFSTDIHRQRTDIGEPVQEPAHLRRGEGQALLQESVL